MSDNGILKVGDYTATHIQEAGSDRLLVAAADGRQLFIVNRDPSSALGHEWLLFCRNHKRRVTAMAPALPDDLQTVLLTAIVESRELGIGLDLKW